MSILFRFGKHSGILLADGSSLIGRKAIGSLPDVSLTTGVCGGVDREGKAEVWQVMLAWTMFSCRFGVPVRSYERLSV